MNSPQPQSTFKLLALQIRVINALIRREFIATNGRTGVGFLMMLGEPLVIMGCIMSIGIFRSHLIVAQGAEFPIYAFIVSGWGILWLCRYPMQRVGPAIAANVSFLAHRQITIFDLSISRTILLVMSTLTGFSIIFLIYYLFFLDVRFNAPEYIVLSLIFCVWYAVVSGLLCVAGSSYTFLGYKFGILLAISHIFLTGSIFMADWLPDRARSVMLLSPMLNATEMMRYGMFGHVVPCHFSCGYLFCANLAYTFFTLQYLRSRVRKGKVHGMFG